MLFSLNSLKQFLKTDKPYQELADTLVTLGVEVESTENEGVKFNNIVVGKVISANQHPNADKLKVCMVDIGEEEPKQIVCGAPNMKAGLTVAVAKIGAVMDNGDFVIKKSKIRDVESNGMVCSEKELGTGDDHDGIWEMDQKHQAGEPLADILKLNDVIFDVSITPNRPDVLSVFGLARELAAANMGQLITPTDSFKINESFKTNVSIERKTENCPYFSIIEIKNIKNTESPAWLKSDLAKLGMSSHNLIVDATNYTLMMFGQPLHAYDAAKVEPNFIIKMAENDQVFEGLKDTQVKLDSNDIVINDSKKTLCLAGVLGAQNSSTELETTHIYLEAANFNEVSIALTGQKTQIVSDSRHRFERKVDPKMTKNASMFCANLIIKYCGGEASFVENGTNLAENNQITISTHKIKEFANVNITEVELKKHLDALDYTILSQKDGVFEVINPTFRPNSVTPHAVIEDILRIIGFDKVPLTYLQTNAVNNVKTDKLALLDRFARRQLVSQNFLECLNYSFISNKHAKIFSDDELIEVANPIDIENMSTMRPSIIPSLLLSVDKNKKRGEDFIKFAEVGHAYTTEKENIFASAIISGSTPKTWQNKQKPNFFTIKEELYIFLQSLGTNPDKLQISRCDDAFMHPGKSAKLHQGSKIIAIFGEIHPKVAKEFNIKGECFVFEVNISNIATIASKTPAFNFMPYPAVLRDIAFVVNKNTESNKVIQTIKSANKELIKDVTLFDIYEGLPLKDGEKSLAFAIKLQSKDHTLEEVEIKSIMEKVENLLTSGFNAVVRES